MIQLVKTGSWIVVFRTVPQSPISRPAISSSSTRSTTTVVLRQEWEGYENAAQWREAHERLWTSQEYVSSVRANLAQLLMTTLASGV